MGRPISDLNGKKFGKLTVVNFAGVKNKNAMWECECECGNQTTVYANLLKSGATRSCGCLVAEASLKKRTEAFSNKRLYTVWASMKTRCYNQNHPRYRDWGGRGIGVCPEWRSSFRNFCDWAKASGYDEHAKRGKCTLDRIDNNSGYSPENCRWVDMKEQTHNRKRV